MARAKKTDEKVKEGSKKKVAIKKTEKVEASVVSETPVKKISKKAASKTTVQSTIKIDVLDLKGKVVEQIALPSKVFGAKPNPRLIAQAVRVYLANQRAGSASTKSRGEVAGSTRKIYKQKGTGRARHGGIRAPIFVHGGIAFGPKPHDFSLKLSQNMRKAALFCALSSKLAGGEIKIVSGFGKMAPKTKEMVSVFKDLQLEQQKKILFVLPSFPKSAEDNIKGRSEKKESSVENVIRASRNIEGVHLTRSHLLNTYDVLNNNTILFVKEAIDTLVEGSKKA